MSQAASRPKRVSLIVAMDRQRVIGNQGRLPWHIPQDLKRFKALTIGKPVLMGRKTFVSIGKPLPGRTNIVVSRDPGFNPDGVIVVRDLEQALRVARDDAERRGVGEIAAIGGTDIFTQLLPLADRLEITHVHMRPEGDTYFPPIDATQWHPVARSDHPAGPQDEAGFSFVTYARN